METIAQHIPRDLKTKHQQYILSGELFIRVQRVREYFIKNTLPSPTVELTTAWTGLPNVNLNTSINAEMVFLRVPPPTPAIPALHAVESTSSDLSSEDCSDEDRWVIVDETTTATPDTAAPQVLEGSVTSEDDAMSWPSEPDQPLDQNDTEEDPSQSIECSSLSSDQESLSSCGDSSQKPVGFPNMVNQWLVDYRGRGLYPCVESLTVFGVISMGTALLAARIAREMIKEVERKSYTEAQTLLVAVRFSALAAFKKYWGLDGDWKEVPSAQANTAQPMPYGVNIASLIGCLFGEKLASAKDVHLCLSLLLEGEKRYDRLCAMHALLVQTNDKLCKNRNLPALMQFKDDITSVNRESGVYLWATSPGSNTIITDILATIERWMVTQAIRREECRKNAWSGRRNVRNSAVGPRGWAARQKRAINDAVCSC